MESPARVHPVLRAVEPAVPILVPSRDGSSLVLVDRDGTELARTPTAGFGGELDATFDPEEGVVTTFEPFAEDEGGELWRYPITAERTAFVSEGAKFRSASGTARLASARLGLLEFEESMGTRWKVFLKTGKSAGSVACPRPSSVSVVERAEGAKVVALALDEDAWARVDVDLGPDGWGTCNRVSLPELGLESPRLVVTSDGRELAVGVEDGMLAFRELGATDDTTVIGAPAEALSTAVQAIVPRSGAEDAAVLVALTARPARVVVSWWWSEGGVQAIRSAWVDLKGDARVDDRSMSADLAVVDDTVFAATSAGVFRVDVAFEDGNVVLRRVAFGPEGFASTLTGPITALRHPT